MGVPETVPAHRGQAQFSASRLQHPAEKVFRIEWRAITAGEHQNFRIRARRHSALCQQGLPYRLTHWHISAAVLRLGASKLSFVDGLPHVDRVMNEIDVSPTKREQLALPSTISGNF